MKKPSVSEGPGRNIGSSERRNIRIVLTGTDPNRPKGGIGIAMAGYRKALDERDLFYGLVPTFNAASPVGKWWPWLKAFSSIRSFIRKGQYEGQKIVVFAHAGPWVSILRESMILLWARICGAQTMMQLHSPHIDRYLDRWLGRALLRVAFLPVDSLCVLTPWWQRRLTEANFPRSIVIPNPLPPESERVAKKKILEFDKQPKASKQDADLRVLAMTRLTRGKSVHTVIEALPLLPENVHLLVAGSGSERSALESLAERLGVSNRVRFTGWVSGAKKSKLLEETDIFCLPSRADSFGMGFVEAMSFGKPVVAADSRAIADIVVAGKTGLLVGIEDPVDVAKAILVLKDPALRFRMGEAGITRVLKNFSSSIVGARIEAAAVSLVNGYEAV